MFKVGDKVWYDSPCGDPLACVVTGTFYEDGDPVQGVILVAFDGTPLGTANSQDCTPRREG